MSLEALQRILAKEDKENNQALLYLLQTLGEKRLFEANEFNDIRDALGYLDNGLSAKQNSLGFTPENVANKATSLASPNNTTYPTTQAVADGLALKQDTLTNPITGTGASGQVAFFNGATTQIGDSGLFWDNTNKRLGVGATPATDVRFDVRAQGALSTDIAFRVRNSANTRNFLTVNGLGDVFNNGAGGVSTNTFFGENAGRNTTGSANSFFGQEAGLNNTTGFNNSFVGVSAGRNNTTGGNNSFVGLNAGLFNTTGSANSFFGLSAGQNNTTGGANSFFGQNAGRTLANGSTALTISNNSVFLGNDTRANADNQTNQIVIGHTAIGLGSNTSVIGNSSTTLFRPYGNVAIGADTAGARLDVRAQGALSTDIAFRVRNSANTDDLLDVRGNGNIRLNGLQTFQGTIASDTAPLGAELLTTGTGDASWTGIDFATGYTHIPGSITTLTSSLAGIVNTFYQIAYTITGRTAGSVTIAFGGQSIAGVTATGTFGPRATTTGTLVITPTTDFDGTIVLSIKTIGASSATTTLRDSTGVATNEIRVSNINTNTFIGVSAGSRNTTGGANSFFGREAGRDNTTGFNNTFFGQSAGSRNTTGNSNSFFGREAGLSNTTGVNNSFFGNNAGFSNTTGVNNTFFGQSAGFNNTTANNNTAIGLDALRFTTTGANNTAIGANALRFTTTGANNTAIGANALRGNTTGANNTSIGFQALLANTTGANNTAIGLNALLNNTTGSGNTAIGLDSARRISGGTNLTIANNSVFIGEDTRALADNQTNQIVIGHTAIGAGSNTATIGNTSIVDTVLRGRVNIQQYATGSRPAYVKGALIYDSTLSKLVVGGATGWEVVTSL